MLNTILVPLDGSPAAECAISCALGIAPAGQTVLLHVAPNRQDCSQAHEYVSGLSQRYVATGLRATTVLRYGNPVEQILKEANETFIDLVVMSAHGDSAGDHALMGGVPYALVHRLPVPLLLYTATDHRSCGRIVLVLDSAARAAGTLPPLEQLGQMLAFVGEVATATNRQVIFFQATKPEASALGELDPSVTANDIHLYNERLSGEVETALYDLAKRLPDGATGIVAPDGDLQEAVRTYLCNQPADLVVFAVQRQSAYNRQILDTLIYTALHECATSTLLYPVTPPLVGAQPPAQVAQV